MPEARDYSADTEFQKLCARRGDVDLTVAALELARDADPGLEFRDTLHWIETRGGELTGPIARARSEFDMLIELTTTIAETYGIRGDYDAYERAESSFLPRVIEHGRGIPISLALLYIAVARRAGLELAGVSAPAHFLARYESSGGPLFLDAFSGRRVLSQPECLDWLHAMTQLPRHQIEPDLKPARPRTTILRMLNNLKAVYWRQEDWQAAWKVQHRLATLQPASYAERRDLGVVSLRADRPADAIDLLGACLKTAPPDERELLETHLNRARGQLARWN